jgi:hypothetical protein
MAIGPREPSIRGDGLKSELREINHEQADSPHVGALILTP